MMQNLPDDEFDALYQEVVLENHRRMTMAAIPQQMADLNAQFLDAEGAEQGDPWRRPTGAHDAFPLGWTVTHDGRQWESLVAANVFEPPTNWRQVVAGGCPPWVQPGSAADAYRIGDCVTFEGGTWVSLIDANVWSPTAHPAGWQKKEEHHG
jgi:hypothetical protein